MNRCCDCVFFSFAHYQCLARRENESVYCFAPACKDFKPTVGANMELYFRNALQACICLKRDSDREWLRKVEQDQKHEDRQRWKAERMVRRVRIGSKAWKRRNHRDEWENMKRCCAAMYPDAGRTRSALMQSIDFWLEYETNWIMPF